MSERLLWWCSFAAFGFLSLVWSASIPLMGAPDKPSHAVKAAAVARGDLTTKSKMLRGVLGSVIPETAVRLPHSYAGLFGLASCYGNTAGPTVACARIHAVQDDGPVVSTSTYVGAYQPLYYALVGWPSRFLPAREALYAMRALGALISAALLASGVSSAAAVGRRGLLLAVALLGLTPMAVFLTGSINPNGLEITAAFCVWLATLDLVTTPRPASVRLLTRVGVSSLLLAWCRPLSPVFLVVIVVVVALIAADRARLQALWSESAGVRILGGIVVAVTAGALSLFLIANRSLTSLISYPPVKPPSHLSLARNSFARTGSRVEQMIGVLGWLSLTTPHLPGWLVNAWELAVLTTIGGALLLGHWRQRAVLAATLLGILALPVVSDTVEGAKYGPNWQGRYALPLAVGLPILAGWIIDMSSRDRLRSLRWGATALAIAVPFGWLVAQASVIAQAVQGAGASWTQAFATDQWAGPFTPALLLGAGVIATLVLCGCFVGATWAVADLDPLSPATHPPTSEVNAET